MKCFVKNCYTKKVAQEALNRLISEGRWSHKQQGRIYQCETCNLWHITHIEEFGDKSIVEGVKFKSRWMKLLEKKKER